MLPGCCSFSSLPGALVFSSFFSVLFRLASDVSFLAWLLAGDLLTTGDLPLGMDGLFKVFFATNGFFCTLIGSLDCAGFGDFLSMSFSVVWLLARYFCKTVRFFVTDWSLKMLTVYNEISARFRICKELGCVYFFGLLVDPVWLKEDFLIDDISVIFVFLVSNWIIHWKNYLYYVFLKNV